MAGPNTPLEQLRAFREILIAQRRVIVQSVFEGRAAVSIDPPQHLGAEHGGGFKAIQDQIDAVDRAILDEQGMEPPGPLSGPSGL